MILKRQLSDSPPFLFFINDFRLVKSSLKDASDFICVCKNTDS